MVGSTCLGACSARCGPRMSWERLHERVATARKLGCSEECPFASLPGVSKALRRFGLGDRKSTRLNSSHGYISYAVFCLKKKNIPTPDAGFNVVVRAHVGATTSCRRA